MSSKQVSAFFNKLGLSPNLKGYPYLVYITTLTIAKSGNEVPKLKDLYTLTGKHFGVPATTVSENIRTVLIKYWNQPSSREFFRITRYGCECRLPLKEFITVTAEYLSNCN